MAKDVLYLEVDDEITTVIDKLNDSAQGVVALVLPKRATVFQSVVNMKLLQRAAKQSKKSVVLITSDTTVLGIAGVAGMHVAKNLQTKPAIPPKPKTAHEEEAIEFDNKSATAVAAGAGAAVVAKKAANPDDEADDTIELDNSGDDKLAKTAALTAKNKKLRVPDFGSFRVRLFLGIFAAVLLIVGSIFAFVILPKATITIATNTNSLEISANFIASVTAKEVDSEKRVLPASLAEVSKTDTEKVAATGEKNIGEKATGTMSVINCNRDDETINVPAGTVFSAGGFGFVSTEAVNVAASNFTGGGVCKEDKTANVAVVASQPGDSYNLSARGYSTQNSDISGEGSQMAGGTNNLVRVVQQQDIDNAANQMSGRSKTAALGELSQRLGSLTLYAIPETLLESKGEIKGTPAVGQEANEVTVTATTKYTMLGVAEESLKELLEREIRAKMSNEQQEIQSDGLDEMIYRVVQQPSVGEQTIAMQTVAVVGPDINTERIAQDAAGKKRGEIQEMIGTMDGVTDVQVSYSPFWVLQTPNSQSKIKVVLVQSE